MLRLPFLCMQFGRVGQVLPIGLLNHNLSFFLLSFSITRKRSLTEKSGNERFKREQGGITLCVGRRRALSQLGPRSGPSRGYDCFLHEDEDKTAKNGEILIAAAVRADGRCRYPHFLKRGARLLESTVPQVYGNICDEGVFTFCTSGRAPWREQRGRRATRRRDARSSPARVRSLFWPHRRARAQSGSVRLLGSAQ